MTGAHGASVSRGTVPFVSRRWTVEMAMNTTQDMVVLCHHSVVPLCCASETAVRFAPTKDQHGLGRA